MKVQIWFVKGNNRNETRLIAKDATDAVEKFSEIWPHTKAVEVRYLFELDLEKVKEL